jgi:hypothetical protein
MWIMWDGVGFFGASELKLERLEGKKPRWYDRCKSMTWMSVNITMLCLIILVLTNGFSSLGTIKSQEVKSVYQKIHKFNVQEQMKIFAVVYFDMDDLMPIVNKQVSAKIPRYMNDWSKEQFDFMVEFMCDRIHF